MLFVALLRVFVVGTYFSTATRRPVAALRLGLESDDDAAATSTTAACRAAAVLLIDKSRVVQ